MAVTVYFATNRVATGSADLSRAFGADIGPPNDAGALTYATAFVQNVSLNDASSGQIVGIEHAGAGGFDAAVTADILGGKKNLLVFIHGFANAFSDAITRAAFNREWFAASGVAPADTTVLTFTWPSLGEVVAAPPHLLPDDYLRDQRFAGRSGFHVASFFDAIRPVLEAARAAGCRCFLLAHSMGNYALQAAVDAWFSSGRPATPLFDEVFLAAADERADSFTYSPGARLSRLGDLAPRVSIYASERDVAMYLSTAVNLTRRLGHDGPERKGDPAVFPPQAFRIVDAADVGDYNLIVPPDASHQYYRRSPKVRADIAAVMADAAGTVPGGLITL